jgi:hypothetical protein
MVTRSNWPFARSQTSAKFTRAEISHRSEVFAYRFLKGRMIFSRSSVGFSLSSDFAGQN